MLTILTATHYCTSSTQSGNQKDYLQKLLLKQSYNYLLSLRANLEGTLLCCMQKAIMPSLQQIKPTSWLQFSPTCTTIVAQTMLSDERCIQFFHDVSSTLQNIMLNATKWPLKNSTLICLHKYYEPLNKKKQFLLILFQVILLFCTLYIANKFFQDKIDFGHEKSNEMYAKLCLPKTLLHAEDHMTMSMLFLINDHFN